MTYETLEHVAMQRRPYPNELLAGAETGLVLFAAAFLGHNDAIHFALANVETVCVDTDEERLSEMRALYPDTWAFVTADAWKYAEAARDLGLRWDVVSLDPFTGASMERVHASLELWTELAEFAVIVGAPVGVIPEIPTGWEVTHVLERSEIAAWLVLEREA